MQKSISVNRSFGDIRIDVIDVEDTAIIDVGIEIPGKGIYSLYQLESLDYDHLIKEALFHIPKTEDLFPLCPSAEIGATLQITNVSR